MMSDRYLKQKLFEALHALVSDGPIRQRLEHAGGYLLHLRAPNDVLDDQKYATAVDDIIKKLTADHAVEIKTGCTRLSDVDANEISHQILGMFTDVMGGL